MLAALPSDAKHNLRLSCRASRAAVDAHARLLSVKYGQTLLNDAAAARMPMLKELFLWADNDSNIMGLAAGLRALAQGPATVTCATVRVQGGESALGGIVSALASLTALTGLELTFTQRDLSMAPPPPLVLPWANIQVGADFEPGVPPCPLNAMSCA